MYLTENERGSGCLGLATHTAVLDGYSRECPQSHN